MCSSTREKRIKRDAIFKIALKTISRIGAAVILLWILGFYLMFLSCEIFLVMQSETQVPTDLIVLGNSKKSAYEDLIQLDGVEKVSPLQRIQTELSADGYTQQIEIMGVKRNFLSMEMEEGTHYADHTQMPFLVLNQMAAESFVSAEPGEEYTAKAGDQVTLSCNGKVVRAVVSGVFQDKGEIPRCYMSYSVATRLNPTLDFAEYILTVKNRGETEHIAEKLQKYNLTTAVNEEEILRWDFMEKQSGQYLITALVCMACALLLVLKNQFQQEITERGQHQTLRSMGFSEKNISAIQRLRVAEAMTSSYLSAMILVGIQGKFSICAMIVGTIVGIVFWFIIFLCPDKIARKL